MYCSIADRNDLHVFVDRSEGYENSLGCLNHRSEGVAERDIGSLRMMGWGLMLAENSSAAVVVAAVIRAGDGGPLDFREIICFSEN